MILTNEQAEDRLESPNNLANRFSKVIVKDSNSRLPVNLPEIEIESEEIPDLSNLEEISPILNSSNPPNQSTTNILAVEAFSDSIQSQISEPQFSVQTKKLRNPGRLAGVKGLTTEQRTEIAIAKADSSVTQVELAEKYGVTQPAINYIQGTDVVKVDKKSVEKVYDAVVDSAVDRLMTTLGFITDAKLEALGAEKLSNVASQMSSVVERVRPKDNKNEGGKVNVVIFSPEQRSESSYSVIEVSS